MTTEPNHTIVDASRVAPAVVAEATNRKEFLPRRSGESRFAPLQYFYSASKSAALPIAAASGAANADTLQSAA